MKKRLLSLLTLTFLLGGGIFAQTWTAPELPTSYEGVEYVADGTTAYYLYNVECGEFVTGANSWATQISLGTQGPYMELVVEPMSEDEEEAYPGAVKLKLNGTFYFTGGNNRTNYAVSNTYLFRDSETSGFIDHASQTIWYWQFEKADGDKYYWHSISGNGVFPLADEQYARATAPGDPVLFNGTIEDTGIEWKFVPVESYDANARELYAARLALYNQAKLIVDEELEAYGVSYEEYTDVYNGTDVDAINAATTELAAKVVEARKAKAWATGSEDNPADVTFLLTNPKFSGNDTGWTVDVPGAQNKGYQGATYTNDLEDAGENAGVTISGFIEAWVPGKGLGDGKIYQTVELPLGKYVLGVDVMATNQYTEGDAKEEATGFQLYALGGGIDNGVDVSSYNGKPEHYEFEFITAGGTTELGLRMIDAQGNWFGADNFTVFYKGNDIDPYYFALPSLVENCENIDEYVPMNADVREAYQEALNAARELVGAEEGNFETVYKALSEAVEALNASAAAYARLETFVQRVASDTEAYEGNESLSATISTLYDQYQTAFDDENATNEQIEEWIAGYDTFLLAAVKEAMPTATEGAPLRISVLGKNLDYADNELEPWVNTSSAYKVNYHNGEVWQASFSCLQTIENLPAGKYIIKAKAFYRDAPNAEHYENYQYGNADITTYLVANENKALVPALALAAVEGEAAPEGSNYAETSEGSGIWMPNNQQAAEWAFNNTDFFDCEVSTYLPEDGNLVFGTRNDDITEANNQWSVWSQFDIYYAGKSKSALYEQVQVLAEQLNEKINDGALISVTAAEEKANTALDVAEKTTESDSEETLSAIIQQLKEAMSYIDEGQSLIQKLSDLYNVYDELLGSLDGVSTDETFTTLLTEEVGAAITEEKFASNEQIQGWIDALPAAWVGYVMGQDMSDASAENPFYVTEIIFNPDFEMSATREQAPPYWTVDALGKNNGFQNNNTYSNADGDITLSNFIESWTPSGNLTDGQISQTLVAALPAGFYRLEADGKSSSAAEGVTLGVTDGDKMWATPVKSDDPAHWSVDFESDGEKVLTIGIFVKECNVGWVAFDNFLLAYIGSDVPDAVEGVVAEEVRKPIVIYNLAGQRVSKAQKGIYIVNGKKVLF